MEGEIQMETQNPEPTSCPHCVKAAEDAAKKEELGMAFLLAILPVITLTFFGQVGLL